MTECLTKQQKGLRGKRNSTQCVGWGVRDGGALWIFRRLVFETPRTNSSFLCGSEWVTDPKSEETNSALSGPVWNWTAAPRPLAAAAATTINPPPFSPLYHHSHCTCSQATCLFNCLTWQSIRWSTPPPQKAGEAAAAAAAPSYTDFPPDKLA